MMFLITFALPNPERCQSGRMGRSRKPLTLVRGSQGSNPCLSAKNKIRRVSGVFYLKQTGTCSGFAENEKRKHEVRGFCFLTPPLRGSWALPKIPVSPFPIARIPFVQFPYSQSKFQKSHPEGPSSCMKEDEGQIVVEPFSLFLSGPFHRSPENSVCRFFNG